MTIPRSRQLLDHRRSGLLVVDLQQRLLPVIPRADLAVWNASRLLRAAELLGVTRAASEQSPQKLGVTDERLRALVGEPQEKTLFSAGRVEGILQRLEQADCEQIVLCGIETHVCILQTALDLLAGGYEVAVVADAVAARGDADHRFALERMRLEGAIVTTTEGVLFEWCETADCSEFRAISGLVKEQPPVSAT